jgi:tRNA/rRNA methyltransferase
MSQSSAQEALSSVRIVLVAPAGPLNVGSVARVMKNFGLSQLVLVDSQCDPLSEAAMQMAVHAKDVLHAARRVSSVPEALQGCQRAIATTARQRGFNAPLELPEVVLPALLSIALADTALLFGPEDRGLSNEELTYAQQFIKVPTDEGYSALNLAQAVAICCYELHRASRSSYLEQPRLSPNTLTSEQNSLKALRSSPLSAKQTDKQMESAALDELEGYYQHLEQLLLKVEYLYPHTAHSRMRKFRQLLHRAEPNANEVALLRGVLRQIEWALSEPPSSRSSDS